VVEPVSAIGREVYPADERDRAVDDHELLVVAVKRTLAGVERDANLRAVCERVAHFPGLGAVGVKERQRRTGPREKPDVKARRPVGEEVAERHLAVVAQAEVGEKNQPASQTDERADSIAAAISASASAPSTRTSSSLPAAAARRSSPNRTPRAAHARARAS
jgi:hypothetical protein